MICATAMTLAQGPRRDGKWEVTMEMDMPGMPMKMPPVVTTQCVTKEDVDDPQKALPKGPAGRGNDNCKVSDYKMEGNKVTWTMKCEGKQPMSGSGEMVYGDEKYTGAIKMDMNGSTMTMKYAGKRVGDCQK
jgi:hypothetical protein